MEYIDIPNYTGYVASRNGNIYSMIPKGCRDRFDRKLWLKIPKLLKARTTKSGYQRVFLRNDKTNKREDVYIHRIIGELFLSNPNNLPEINHKDCNRSNNSVDNLEWVTKIENFKYSMKYGFMTRNLKGQFAHK